MSQEELVKQLQVSLNLFLGDLSENERSVVDNYNVKKYFIRTNIYPFDRIEKDPNSEIAISFQVNDFARPKFGSHYFETQQQSKSSPKAGKNIPWHDYARLATDSFIGDLSLFYLQQQLLNNIPEEFKCGVKFNDGVVTGCLTDTGNNRFKAEGEGFIPKGKDNTYNGFFGRDSIMSHWQRIFFPFNTDNSHYVGAIVHPHKNKVVTFDHYGLNRPTHDYVFSLMEPMLNHALKREGKLVSSHPGWLHERVDVPKQTDSISCGLLQIVNGTILTLIEDVEVAKRMLVSQEQVASFVRPKLMASILTNMKINYTRPQLIEQFKAVEQSLQQGRDAHAKAANKAAAELKAKGEKKRGTSANKAGSDTAMSSTKSTAKSLKKSSSAKSSTKSPIQAALENNAKLKVPQSFEDAYRNGILNDHGHLFATIGRDPPLSFIDKCFDLNRSAAKRNAKQLKKSVADFVSMCNYNYSRLLCLHELGYSFFCRFEGVNKDEVAFAPVLAKYLVDSIVEIFRAYNILDNGKLIVNKDKGTNHHHCADWYRKRGQGGMAAQFFDTYPHIDKEMILKASGPWHTTLKGWSHKVSDTKNNVDDFIDNVMRSVSKMIFLDIDKKFVSAKVVLVGGGEYRKLIEGMSPKSNESKQADPSHPPSRDFNWVSYRFEQLKKLYRACVANKVEPPKLLVEELQTMLEGINTDRKTSINHGKASNTSAPKTKRRRIYESSSDEEDALEESQTEQQQKQEEVKEDQNATKVSSKDVASGDASEMKDGDIKLKQKDVNEDQNNATKVRRMVGADDIAESRNKDVASGDASEMKDGDMVDADDIAESRNKDVASGDASERKDGDIKLKQDDVNEDQNNATKVRRMVDADDIAESRNKDVASGDASDMKDGDMVDADDIAESRKRTYGTTSSEKTSNANYVEPLVVTKEIAKAVRGGGDEDVRLLKKIKSESLQRKSDRFVVSTLGKVGAADMSCSFERRNGTTSKRTTRGKDVGNYHYSQSGSRLVMEMKKGEGEAERPDENVVTCDFHSSKSIERFRHNNSNNMTSVNILDRIGRACGVLQKQVGTTALLRDDNAICKNMCLLPAVNFIIPDCDNVELVDHTHNNTNTCQVMVRISFPSNPEHGLLKELKRQLEDADYNKLLDVATKNEGLVMISFVSTYFAGSNTANRQKSMEQLIFHSFILMTKPKNKMQNMDIKFGWTSDAYCGVTHERLMQIGCIIYWQEEKKLTVNCPENNTYVPSELNWNAKKETLADIMIRSPGNRPPIALDTQNSDLARTKTENMTQALMINLRHLVRPTADRCDTLVSEFPSAHVTDVAAKLAMVPLSMFTHYLNEVKQNVTELSAELLQSAIIMPTTKIEDDGTYHKWRFVFHCTCCVKPMNTPLPLVTLLQLGTRIIQRHNFDCDDDDEVLMQHLGEVDRLTYDGFEIFPCQTTLEKRMSVFDALRVDNGRSKKLYEHRLSNAVGLTSALLPTQLHQMGADTCPLAHALCEYMAEACNDALDLLLNKMKKRLSKNDAEKLGDNIQPLYYSSDDKPWSCSSCYGKHPTKKEAEDCSATCNGSNSILLHHTNDISRYRPLQDSLDDLSIHNPISSLEPHESWSRRQQGLSGNSKNELDIAKKGGAPIKVGSYESISNTVTASEVGDGTGDEVLHMLMFFYAKFIIRIERDTTFDSLAEKFKRTIKLPNELNIFMNDHPLTEPIFVVITETITKNNSQKTAQLSRAMASKLTWFVPSDFFLTLFPKSEIDRLREGKIERINVDGELRNKLRRPIQQSLKQEIRDIKLHSLYPHKVFSVTLADGKTTKFIDGKEKHMCLQYIQERWYLDRLRDLCHVSSDFGVSFGVGKKQPTTRAPVPRQNGRNFWTDHRNKHSQCLQGGVANWLAAAGCVKEAQQLKEWAESKNLFAGISNGDEVKGLFAYMYEHFQMQSVTINFTKETISLDETVSMFKTFPAPCLLLLSSVSSTMKHSVMVSGGVVYDFQDMSPYTLTRSTLNRKMNGDNDVVTLAGAYYFFMRGSSLKGKIKDCPNSSLEIHQVPEYGTLISSLGSNRAKVKKKKKKKRKRKRSNN